MRDLIKINNASAFLPPPRTYAVYKQDVDSEDTGRTETGVMYRNRLRNNVYKIVATWRVPTSKLKIVTDSITASKFNVYFYDPTSTEYRTVSAYAGDRQAEMILNGDTDDDTWWDLSVNFIGY